MSAVIYHPDALDNAALLHAAQTLVAAGWSYPHSRGDLCCRHWSICQGVEVELICFVSCSVQPYCNSRFFRDCVSGCCCQLCE